MADILEADSGTQTTTAEPAAAAEPVAPSEGAPATQPDEHDVLATPAPAETQEAQAEGATSAEAGEKPGEQKAADAPDYSDLKAPEGALFAEGALDQIKALAGEHKLTPETAQAITDAYAKALADGAAAQEAALAEAFNERRAAIMANKEFFGTPEKAAESKAAYARAMDKFAPGLRAAYTRDGIVPSPEEYIAWARVGRGMAESSSPTVDGTEPSAEPSAKTLFPNSPEMWSRRT